MRTIHTDTIIEAVKNLCIEANCSLPNDVYCAIEKSIGTEKSQIGKGILEKIKENADIAKEQNMPICQDTGMAIFFVKIGQDVHIEGEYLYDAINEGVRRGYKEGYMRNSIVRDPLDRVNTGDNTPAVIHTEIVAGDKLEIIFAPKGFGSENMSATCMLKPSQGEAGVIDFVLDTVKKAGANPCPPIFVGVGIGGSMEKAAILSKYALTRDVEYENPNPYYRKMEEFLKDEINKLGIGPQGFGGSNTCLRVFIETFPTHIAGLPVAVNICCHVLRHKKIVI
ncbi:MAG: fumarate hydratase [Clostridiaceae bacterium]|nr:fumarate hydratase [Clostridiaceae bacterium]